MRATGPTAKQRDDARRWGTRIDTPFMTLMTGGDPGVWFSLAEARRLEGYLRAASFYGAQAMVETDDLGAIDRMLDELVAVLRTDEHPEFGDGRVEFDEYERPRWVFADDERRPQNDGRAVDDSVRG